MPVATPTLITIPGVIAPTVIAFVFIALISFYSLYDDLTISAGKAIKEKTVF